MKEHAQTEQKGTQAPEYGPGQPEEEDQRHCGRGEVKEVQNDQGPPTAPRHLQNERRRECDRRGTVRIGAALEVGGHPEQLDHIEAVAGQGDRRRKQPHRRIPHRWLVQRRPLQSDNDYQCQEKLSAEALLQEDPGGGQPLHIFLEAEAVSGAVMVKSTQIQAGAPRCTG